MSICIFKYETIVSRNGFSLGHSERDTSSVCRDRRLFIFCYLSGEQSIMHIFANLLMVTNTGGEVLLAVALTVTIHTVINTVLVHNNSQG